MLRQIAQDTQGRPVASTLLVPNDGREQPLPFGEGLMIRGMWTANVFQTVVKRGHEIVMRGTYTICASDGRLHVANGARELYFERVPDVQERQRPKQTRRRPSVAAIVVFALCAGVACSSATSSYGVGPRQRLEADTRAIQALNDHDIKAGLESDVEAVVSQWSAGFVQLPATGPIIRGRDANVAVVMEARKQLALFEPISYEVDVEEITVAGDYAFSWGAFRTRARVRANGSEIGASGKLLRIYQRQSDGRWLMHRTMSTLDKTQ